MRNPSWLRGRRFGVVMFAVVAALVAIVLGASLTNGSPSGSVPARLASYTSTTIAAAVATPRPAPRVYAIYSRDGGLSIDEDGDFTPKPIYVWATFRFYQNPRHPSRLVVVAKCHRAGVTYRVVDKLVGVSASLRKQLLTYPLPIPTRPKYVSIKLGAQWYGLKFEEGQPEFLAAFVELTRGSTMHVYRLLPFTGSTAGWRQLRIS